MSLSELETFHHLCELERTKILQSLALAVKRLGKIIRQQIKFYRLRRNILWYYTSKKKV